MFKQEGTSAEGRAGYNFLASDCS